MSQQSGREMEVLLRKVENDDRIITAKKAAE
jgi:hypothetical protein